MPASEWKGICGISVKEMECHQCDIRLLWEGRPGDRSGDRSGGEEPAAEPHATCPLCPRILREAVLRRWCPAHPLESVRRRPEALCPALVFLFMELYQDRRGGSSE